MNDPVKLSAEFQELLVTPLEIYDGERGMVVLLKVRRKVDALIKKHNKLVELCSRGAGRTLRGAGSVNKDSSAAHINKPQDVIDYLIQLRYICDCVAPAVVWLETLTYRHHWCKDCNKPYLEKED